MGNPDVSESIRQDHIRKWCAAAGIVWTQDEPGRDAFV